ncbi:hypothetical protein PV08_05603 [Exophiala spinifera]|uniref:DUF4219 domain-containing protein n=1 Tax=Exophiala spinifera TaxID=91928 RepID=A0A0D2BAG5_9EURO|nr:uncharacterized protein PV08_05603 [Exophiala spinifera]KIW15555.1 hypothetical protein PV08_05603 [Exophiala spinifera]
MSELNPESQRTKPITITLSKSSDWDNWFLAIKVYAKQQGIWEYVDPEVLDPPVLKYPSIPDIYDANSGAVPSGTLDERQKLSIRFVERQWEHDCKKYEEKTKAIKALGSQIIGSLLIDLMQFLEGDHSPHVILLRLKRRFAPVERSRELDILTRWKNISKTPKTY